MMHNSAPAEWTAPENPSPKQILREARDDADAGRYEDALMKHIWYHRNALKWEPAQRGVRLSFALGYWKELGEKFEPARTEYLQERDRLKALIDADHGDVNAIWEWSSFNSTIGETKASADLFLQLHAEKSPSAARVYTSFEEALIAEKQYEVCGRYLNAAGSYETIVRSYGSSLKMAEARPDRDQLQLNVIHSHFAREAAEVVALLAINKRKEEATKYADLAKAELKDARFKFAIDDALNGQMPDRERLLKVVND
jgi:hypothetical protein